MSEEPEQAGVMDVSGVNDHRWSGWPGAWCLDCGDEDQREWCLAQDHPWEPNGPNGELVPPSCCKNRPCPEPGSKRNDPYADTAHGER